MAPIDKIAGIVTGHNRLTAVVLLAVVLVMAAGLPAVGSSAGVDQFQPEGEAARALEYADANFTSGAEVSTLQVVVRDENALDRETLVDTLEFQRAVRRNSTIHDHLVADSPTAGIANVVATAASRQRNGSTAAADGDRTRPSLSTQLEALRAANESEIDAILTSVLAADPTENTPGAFAYLPREYAPGSDTATATRVVVRYEASGDHAPTAAPPWLVASQEAARDLAGESFDDETTATYGSGLLTSEIQQSMRDSLALVGPAALLFVLVALALAYRDLLDVLLALGGLALVLAWTFGFMGWAGLGFNQVLVTVPVLLIGLSVDYAIHVVMHYREVRNESGADPRAGMRTALAGVGVALAWVTVTTVIGFLSNGVSSIEQIRTFGVISAAGIVGAFVVFGGLVPAVKVELDRHLESYGFDRRQRALGTGGGAVASALAAGAVSARQNPFAVLAVALLVTGGGAYAATTVDSTFGPRDFFPGDAPEWTDDLPGPMAPGEYDVKEDLNYVDDHFAREGSRVQLLVRGDVTDPGTLDALTRARARARESGVVVELSTGEPPVTGPVTVLQRVAASNETVRELVAATDVDSDGVPDRDLAAVYDALYDANPSLASRVVHREHGEYRAVRALVTVRGDASDFRVIDEMQSSVAATDWGGLDATATGTPITQGLARQQLLDTTLVSLLVSLAAVFLFLAAAFRVVHGSATLGVVTVVPVALGVAWIVGTMPVLGLPMSPLTATVTSLTVGLGVDYNVHVTSRFHRERQQGRGVHDALRRAVTGTGGALLGSAATTATGFGVLAFAVTPLLVQFGTVTAVTIVYSFLGAMLVLPALLVLWARYVE